ncbi:unnamed protein product [Heterobilharzia americana]|nr:unnamed protein product [Heterobilharzia americana]
MTIISMNKDTFIKNCNNENIEEFQLNQVYTRQGSLEYNLNYCTKLHTLTIGIIRAKNLQYPLELIQYNTCVTVTLAIWDHTYWILLDHQEKKKTLYINKINPEWNEYFNFKLLKSQLLKTNLIIEVFTCDTIGQHKCIGRLDILLKNININLFINKTYTLCNIEICIGLQYQHLQYLLIRLIEMHNFNLNKINKNGIDVIVYVIIYGKIIKSEIISSYKDGNNQYFDHTIIVNLKKHDNLQDIQIYFQLRHLNQYGVKQVLGEISIGSKSLQDIGIKHWLELCKNPLDMNIMWHIWNPVS